MPKTKADKRGMDELRHKRSACVAALSCAIKPDVDVDELLYKENIGATLTYIGQWFGLSGEIHCTAYLEREKQRRETGKESGKNE